METLMTSPAPTTNEGASSTTLVTAEPAAAPAKASVSEPTPAPEGASASTSEPAKAPGAPEKYEFKAPEGQAFDAQVLEAYSTVAKELNLTQEAAQTLLDRIGPVMTERANEQMGVMHLQWFEASKTDKEFGGEKLSENLAVAKKALDQLGTPELRDMLNQSGMGNHPELVRFIYRVGKALSEDTFVGRSTGDKKSAPKDFAGLASALYSSQGV